MKKPASTILLLSLIFLSVQAQQPAQVIRGCVTDAGNRLPMTGAAISLNKAGSAGGTVTDSAGCFRLEAVPVGRYQMTVSFLGYQTVRIPELLVESGKEVIVDIQLQEQSATLQEVVVRASGDASIPHPVSAHVLKVEEQFRFPTTYFDPARLAMSYPGVAGVDDQGNGISIRGNSPASVRWRLEGVDIVNPNHTANAGTFSDRPTAAGGGVNILSAQLLGPSGFLTGAFPAGYGNALGGFLDMRLRNGNDQRMEYTAQASVIGLDVAAEGPLSIGGNMEPGQGQSSFVVNYRYSFVGLLTSLGVDFGDEEINFQDLSFHLNFPLKKGASLGIFGLGGKSRNHFDSPAPDGTVEEDKDRFDIDFDSKMGATGITFHKPLGKKVIWRSTVAISGLEHSRTADLVDGLPAKTRWYDDRINESKLALMTRFSYKKNARNGWEAGMQATQETAGFDTYFTEQNGVSFFTGEVKDWLIQSFVSRYAFITNRLKLTAGLHWDHFEYTFNHSALEPRASLEYLIDAGQSVSLAYGLIGQIQQPQVYLSQPYEPRSIGNTRSQQIVAGFRKQFRQDFRLQIEAYYQSLFEVPVSTRAGSTFSTLNLVDTWKTGGDTLASTGEGTNYGIDVWVEKPIVEKIFFRVGGSLYRSLYTASDGKERPTRFDGRYLLNGTAGREWKKDKEGKTILKGISLRTAWYGGFRYTPIEVASSAERGTTVFNEELAYSLKGKDYVRVDGRVYWRWNRKQYNTGLYIDIQNMTNRANEAYRYYDPVQERVVTKKQLGLIPLISYRVEW